MKSINAAVAEMTQEQISALEANGNITLNVEGVDAVIETADVEIYSEDVPGWTVANEGALTVALDVEVTEELRQEGVAREIVKKIQTMRSKSNASDDAVNKFGDYISNQVLADSLQLAENVDGGEAIELDDTTIYVSIAKA